MTAALAKLQPDSALRNPMAAIIDITATIATATPTYRPIAAPGPPVHDHLVVGHSSSPLRRNGDARPPHHAVLAHAAGERPCELLTETTTGWSSGSTVRSVGHAASGGNGAIAGAAGDPFRELLTETTTNWSSGSTVGGVDRGAATVRVVVMR